MLSADPWQLGCARALGVMVARVYVSSTVADLRAERAAVLDWLRLARHQAVDSYLPDSDTVRDSCLDDVAACDLYVLIAGHRYGFQPASDNPEGLSVTHLEFRRAGECGIPRVALLRTSVPDVRLSDLLDPARAPLVARFREEVAREVRAAEFSDLQGLVQGLSTGVQGELAKVDRREEQQDGRGAGLALRVAPRPVFLAGREALLAELDARLAGGPGPRVAVLCGLGGAGKTSVAVEYAHRHLAEVGVCWQFAAEDPALLAAEFGVLAAQLGAREAADPRDPVASVHGVLARAGAGWLVVFDNAPDRASVAPFVPPAGPGRVLITTQNQIWPPGQAVDVPVLDVEVAADFLVSRTGDPDRVAARELAGLLDGLPLALEQAAAYMQAAGTTLARYLLLFRDRQADLLARGDVAGHPDVAATLGLALSRLAGEAPAAGLVRLLAFLAPEPVPLALLLAGDAAADRLSAEVAAAVGDLLGDEVAAGDAIAALRRYSLVTPAGDGLVLVHRLVQAITRAQLSAEEAHGWEQAAAALVEAAVPANSQLPATWPVCAVLLPHARAVLDLTSSGIWQIAHYLGFSGSYSAARDLCQLIADAHADSDAYGPEHSDTLAARNQLANWTRDGGGCGRGPRPVRRPAARLRACPGRRTPRHPDRPPQPRPLDRAGGGCGRGPRPVRRPAARPRAGPGRRASRHPGHPPQPRLLDRAGGGRGRGPRPVRRPAARPRAGPGRRAPRHPGHPPQPRLLDRGGGGRGRGPRPARRPAARQRAGPGRRAPRHPEYPPQPRLLDRGGGGRGRGPRPARRPAARPRAGPGHRASRHPEYPPQPRLLGRAGGGCDS